MSGADNRAEGRSAIQRDLEKLERWAYVNLVRFTKQIARVSAWIKAIPCVQTGRRTP